MENNESRQERKKDEIGRIDTEIVGKVSREIGNFYGCTDKAKERGLSVEVEVVSDEDFLNRIKLFFEGLGVIEEELDEVDDDKKEVLEAMGVNPDAKRMENERRIRELEESAVKWGGCVVRGKNGGSKILIREGSETDKDEILTHELIHVMAGEDVDGGRGLVSDEGEGNKFNEAVTQLLVLRMKYREITQEDMFEKINKGEIKTGYVNEVHKLLLLLEATKLSGNPLELKEVADIYFGEDEAGVKRYLLLMKILGRTPEKIRSQSERIYEKYLR